MSSDDWQMKSKLRFNTIVTIFGISPRDKGEIYRLVAERVTEDMVDHRGRPNKG